MSVVRWSSDWVSGNEIVFRRSDGLSKMMALSLVLHLAFFSFIFYGRSFWGRSSSAFQSYQVTLVSPPSAPSISPAPPAPAAPAPRAPVAPPPRPASPPVPATKPAPVKGLPPVKEDPERLQEWWKKKVGSIKIPPVQSKTEPAPTQSITKRPMVSPSPVESKTITPQKEESAPQPPAAPITPASKQEASNPPMIATGSASSNASLFRFPYYLKSIENKISGQWAPPPALLQQEIVGVIVQFNVTRRGSIESVEIEKSSGDRQFDQAALRAVYNASPLPPLPDGLTEDPLKVHFSFTVQRGS